ncbi:MAG: hypothetical protein ACRDY7_08300, partial [Acidimicrobiia bacterium]
MSSRLFTLLLVAAVVAGCTGGGGSGDGGEQAEQAEGAEEDPTTTTGEQGADGYSGHGAGSVSEATLAAYAPPPLDPALRAVVQAKLDLRTPNGELLTNDGGRMFFTWSITGSPQVWRLDGPKGFPVQLTGGEDRTSVVAVVPGADKIVVSRDRAGTENPGLFLQPAGGGPLEIVFDEDGVQASALFVSDDGKALYYRANDRRPESYTFYRYDIATGTSKVVFDEDGTWSVADHKGEDTLLLTKTIGSVDTEIYEFDLATKALVPIVGKGEGEEHFAAYGPGDDEVLVLTPKLGEYRRLYRLTDRVAGELVPITPELDHDVSYFTIDEARRRILYTVNEDGYTRLAAMDAASGTPIALPRLPEADHVYQGATTPNGRYTTVTVETARAPAATYVLDWQNGGLTEWHTVSMPETDPADFAVATLEHYVARDGTEIPMFVRRPPGCDDGGERAV